MAERKTRTRRKEKKNVPVGHAHIHNHDIGSETVGQIDSLLSIIGFADNFDVWFTPKECRGALAEHNVIVCQN